MREMSCLCHFLSALIIFPFMPNRGICEFLREEITPPCQSLSQEHINLFSFLFPLPRSAFNEPDVLSFPGGSSLFIAPCLHFDVMFCRRSWGMLSALLDSSLHI